MTSENNILRLNPDLISIQPHFKLNGYGFVYMKAAQNRYMRFLPYIAEAFPETAAKKGVVESVLETPAELYDLPDSKSIPMKDRIFIKNDAKLPIAGCLQGRGGIHAVLKEAESIAQKAKMLAATDKYSVVNTEKFQELYKTYTLIADGNENLVTCVKKVGSKLGFHVISEDETCSAENQLVLSEEDLFFGYSSAALRLNIQLYKKNAEIDADHPLFVYIPGSDMLAAYGLIFGLKQLHGDLVHCFIIDPAQDDNFGTDLASCLVSGIIRTTGQKEGCQKAVLATAESLFHSNVWKEYIGQHDLNASISNAVHVYWKDR